MSVRYECKLSPEVLKKAVDELNEPEDNALRLEAIDSLRDRFLNDIGETDIMPTDDAFILRFLRFRKFDEKRAFQAMKNYHNLRKTWKDVFHLVNNPSMLENFLDVGSVVPLKRRAKDGSFISIGRPGRNFGKNDGITQFIAVTILTTEKLLQNEEMQIYGVTVIEDLKNFSIGLSMQMTLVSRQFMHLMQDALPVRIKNLSVVYEGFAFDIIFTFIKPFLNSKLRRRMEMHGSEMKTLQERIDPECLPAFLGGTGPDQDIRGWKSAILGKGKFC